jgi:hypothetical protein
MTSRHRVFTCLYKKISFILEKEEKPTASAVGFFIAESHWILRLPAGRQGLKPARR